MHLQPFSSITTPFLTLILINIWIKKNIEILGNILNRSLKFNKEINIICSLYYLISIASYLQPFSSCSMINTRLDALEYLVQHQSLYITLQVCIYRVRQHNFFFLLENKTSYMNHKSFIFVS